jgi:hypothetical protein
MLMYSGISSQIAINSSQVTIVSSTVAITLIGSTIVYYYAPQIKNSVCRNINWLCDQYLNYKYRNYVPPKIETSSKYKITKLIIHNPNNCDLCEIIWDQFDVKDLSFGESINLSCKEIKKITGFECDHETLIYVYYSYVDANFIIPLKMTDDEKFQIPFYKHDDIDSCLRMEFENIETKYNQNHEQLSRIISQFAGPKGNFYADTAHPVTLNQIWDLETLKPLVSKDNELDYLSFETMLGQKYTFQGNSQLVIDTI